MHDIDFLPAEYRQQHARRQVQPWRVVVVVAFVALVATAAGMQHRQRLRVQAERAAVLPQYEEAARQNRRMDDLQSQLQLARSDAELWTYVRHPWPRTQVLAAIVGPLPKEITLSQLHIGREGPPRAPAAEPRPQTDKAEAEKAQKLLPAQRDLKRLREEFEKSPVLVRMSGTASDTDALHRYLGALSKTDLFAKADLRSVESADAKPGAVLKFQVVLVLRPGYGQPGGPVEAEEDAKRGA